MGKEIKINGIWYLLDIDEQEAMVIRSQDKEYSDEIIIPSSFFQEGITYSVIRIKHDFILSLHTVSYLPPK